LKRLGIDEIALRKGQKDFITVLTDLDRKVLIGLAPSRLQKDVRSVIEAWGSEVCSEIIEVSIDLSGNYRGLVQKLLPQAAIVADRFHVTKIVNQEVNLVRRAVLSANENNPDPVEKEKVKEALKQSKYALLKPEAHLTRKQKLKLAEVKAVSPLLTEAHQQKEAFRDIFETSKNWTEGMLSLLDWLAENQKRLHSSVGTISRWLGEVSAYFDYRTTSGAVEGINNKLKLIKRSGYGFRNFENFRLRCLICWHLDCSSA
jgi:transposase